MLMYSALHIMQWFSDCLDVFTLKIRRKFFDFFILINQNKCCLHKTWSDHYNTVVHYNNSLSPASNWFVTLCCKLLNSVSSSSKHGRLRSRLLLYSISMVKITSWFWCLCHTLSDLRDASPSLGELERRHIPNFSVIWHHLASFGIKRRHLTSMTPNLTSLTLNFSSLTLIWLLWRRFGISGADLVSLALSDTICRQTISSDAKWYQRHQNHHSNQIMFYRQPK